MAFEIKEWVGNWETENSSNKNETYAFRENLNSLLKTDAISGHWRTAVALKRTTTLANLAKWLSVPLRTTWF